MQIADDMDLDPLQASHQCGTVTVLVTPATISIVLGPDYTERDHAAASKIAGLWPHCDTEHDTIYLPSGEDVLIYLRN